MIRRPPRSTLFPYTSSSDLLPSTQQSTPAGNRRGSRSASMTSLPARAPGTATPLEAALVDDRKSTRLNSSHANLSYAVLCFKQKERALATGNCSTPGPFYHV